MSKLSTKQFEHMNKLMQNDVQLRLWKRLGCLETQLIKAFRVHVDEFRDDVVLIANLFSYIQPCEVMIRLLARHEEMAERRISQEDSSTHDAAQDGLEQTIVQLLEDRKRFSRASVFWTKHHRSPPTDNISKGEPIRYYTQAMLCIVRIIRQGQIFASA